MESEPKKRRSEARAAAGSELATRIDALWSDTGGDTGSRDFRRRLVQAVQEAGLEDVPKVLGHLLKHSASSYRASLAYLELFWLPLVRDSEQGSQGGGLHTSGLVEALDTLTVSLARRAGFGLEDGGSFEDRVDSVRVELLKRRSPFLPGGVLAQEATSVPTGEQGGSQTDDLASSGSGGGPGEIVQQIASSEAPAAGPEDGPGPEDGAAEKAR